MSEEREVWLELPYEESYYDALIDRWHAREEDDDTTLAEWLRMLPHQYEIFVTGRVIYGVRR